MKFSSPSQALDASPEIPRLESLHHRLLHAKNPDGQPLPLLDELMVFLEEPPPDTGDRWQAGADLCGTHGIATSRMAVWRFYRTHVLQWRRQHAPPMAKVKKKDTIQLLEQTSHLLALRAVEALNDPHLPPRLLVGLIQNENRRQELQLAREKFNDQVEVRRGHERQQAFERIDEAARDRALYPFHLKTTRNFFESLIKSNVAQREALEPKTPPPASPI